MLGYQPWRCMKHNLIADVVMKPRWFLKIVWENFVVNNLLLFYVRIVKGPKTNIFMCKLCAWVIFMILFPRLLCDNSNSLTYKQQKRAKYNTFTCQLCDCTSHADCLFTIIIVTWTYENLFHFVTNALEKALVFWEAIAFKTWRNKLSELKTVSLSRIARENLVNCDDATIYHNDKNPGIS